MVAGGVAYVSHFQDQRLYRIAPGSAPTPLTPAPPDPENAEVSLRYADGRIDAARGLWVGVREDHLDRSREAINTVVAIDLAAGGPGTVLVRGGDFYSSPRLSPDRKYLAWLTWNHPNMPWVGTELWVAGFDGRAVTNPVKVAGGLDESVFQPEWAPDGRLYFVSDRSGWWNVYRREADGAIAAVCPRAAEFGQPAWNFGMSTYAFLSDREAVCSYVEGGLGRLARLNLAAGTLTPFDLPYRVRRGPVWGRKVAFRAGSGTTPAAIVLLDPRTGTTKVLRSATPWPTTRRSSRTSLPRPSSFRRPEVSAYGLLPAAQPGLHSARRREAPLVVRVRRPDGSASVPCAGHSVLDQPRGRVHRRGLRGARAANTGTGCAEVGSWTSRTARPPSTTSSRRTCRPRPRRHYRRRPGSPPSPV